MQMIENTMKLVFLFCRSPLHTFDAVTYSFSLYLKLIPQVASVFFLLGIKEKLIMDVPQRMHLTIKNGAQFKSIAMVTILEDEVFGGIAAEIAQQIQMEAVEAPHRHVPPQIANGQVGEIGEHVPRLVAKLEELVIVKVEEQIQIVDLERGSVESDNRPNAEGKNVPHWMKNKLNSVIRHRVHLQHQQIANMIPGVLGVHVLDVIMDLDPEEEGSKWQHKMVADPVIARMLKRKVVVAQIARLKMIQNLNVSYSVLFFINLFFISFG